MTQSARTLNHLAIIMDGNRRWAKQNNVAVLYQEKSQRAVYEAVSFCQQEGIRHLSLYALSLENLKNRDADLLERLFSLLVTECSEKKDRWIQQNVRVRVVGLSELLPLDVQQALRELEQATAGATGLQLNLLLAYGSQQEITSACQAIAHKVVAGQLKADAITPTTIAEHLWTAHAPPPDLIIRTSGVSRLSNFLLYQAAYSELLFVDYYWPEMTKERLAQCAAQFGSVARNFGK